MPGPVVLCILDGWGIGPDPEWSAPAQASTPNFDRLMREDPHATLVTFGPDVGLPEGQMGNSEVGHTNIGAGRVVAMELGEIDLAIADGSFATNPALLHFIAALQGSGGTAHLMGLVSDGGVHGHVRHLAVAARQIAAAGVPVVIHALTDGRDVAPRSGLGFMRALLDGLPDGVRVGTVIGRYFAMDRDKRWDRVALAARAIMHGEGAAAADPVRAIEASYAAGASDEFIRPAIIAGYGGARDGDGFFCLNFRADRARELMSALADAEFDACDVGRQPAWASVIGMSNYSKEHDCFMESLFPKRPVANTLGAWVAAKGLRQFRIAETEKYPHVTFFLNGGKEAPEAGEVRCMPPSPKVATYDLQPEMSAAEVTEHLVAAIRDRFDLVVVNFANPDMVGHTGSLPAAIRACEAVDAGLGAMIEAVDATGGAAVVIADHGNCELMRDPVTHQPHTSHTTNPVPVIVHGGPSGCHLRPGRLADIAPTALDLMGITPPPEMTGHSLIVRD